MKIIQHGNQYGLGTIACPNCECIFVYNRKDIKIEEWTDYDSYYHDKYDEKVVYCPECHIRLTLEGKPI